MLLRDAAYCGGSPTTRTAYCGGSRIAGGFCGAAPCQGSRVSAEALSGPTLRRGVSKALECRPAPLPAAPDCPAAARVTLPPHAAVFTARGSEGKGAAGLPLCVGCVWAACRVSQSQSQSERAWLGLTRWAAGYRPDAGFSLPAALLHGVAALLCLRRYSVFRLRGPKPARPPPQSGRPLAPRRALLRAAGRPRGPGHEALQVTERAVSSESIGGTGRDTAHRHGG